MKTQVIESYNPAAFDYPLTTTGINFKNAPVEVRSKFSLTPEQQESFLAEAKELGYKDMIVLSTCNRMEVYSSADTTATELLLCKHCNQDYTEFAKYSFTKVGSEALEHIFHVTAGLDSQILGDFEILGQFRNAFKLSKTAGTISSFFDKLSDQCIQASKNIKSHTGLSKGTVSVSYAAIEVLQDRFKDQAVHVLLVGTGKFGNNLAKNIRTYLPKAILTLTNRTESKAIELSAELGVAFMPYSEVQNAPGHFDAIITCVNSDDFLLYPEHIQAKQILIMDLSVPQTIHPEITNISHVEALTIDDVSQVMKETLAIRKSFIPEAETIIEHHIIDFQHWTKVYKHRSKIMEVKTHLTKLSAQCPYLSRMSEWQIEKTMNQALNELIKSIRNGEMEVLSTDQIVERFYYFNHQIQHAAKA